MARTGRPRTFDRDKALRSAVLLFWERGYDGVTLCPVEKIALRATQDAP